MKTKQSEMTKNIHLNQYLFGLLVILLMLCTNTVWATSWKMTCRTTTIVYFADRDEKFKDEEERIKYNVIPTTGRTADGVRVYRVFNYLLGFQPLYQSANWEYIKSNKVSAPDPEFGHQYAIEVVANEIVKAPKDIKSTTFGGRVVSVGIGQPKDFKEPKYNEITSISGYNKPINPTYDEIINRETKFWVIHKIPENDPQYMKGFWKVEGMAPIRTRYGNLEDKSVTGTFNCDEWEQN